MARPASAGVAKTDARVGKDSGELLSHFTEDLLAPVLNALIAQVVLVRFIKRQANEQLPIGNDRFRAGEFIAFRPVADKLNPFGASLRAACRAHQGTIRRSLAGRPCRTARRFYPADPAYRAAARPPPSPPGSRRNPGWNAEDQHIVLRHQGRGIIFRLCSVTSSGPIISRIFSAAISV